MFAILMLFILIKNGLNFVCINYLNLSLQKCTKCIPIFKINKTSNSKFNLDQNR